MLVASWPCALCTYPPTLFFTWHLLCPPPAPIASAALSHPTGMKHWRRSQSTPKTPFHPPLSSATTRSCAKRLSAPVWNPIMNYGIDFLNSFIMLSCRSFIKITETHGLEWVIFYFKPLLYMFELHLGRNDGRCKWQTLWETGPQIDPFSGSTGEFEPHFITSASHFACAPSQKNHWEIKTGIIRSPTNTHTVEMKKTHE